MRVPNIMLLLCHIYEIKYWKLINYMREWTPKLYYTCDIPKCKNKILVRINLYVLDIIFLLLNQLYNHDLLLRDLLSEFKIFSVHNFSQKSASAAGYDGKLFR